MCRYLLGLFLVSALAACGSNGIGPANPATQELDQRHCTTNRDCASGFCSSNGRCG